MFLPGVLGILFLRRGRAPLGTAVRPTLYRMLPARQQTSFVRRRPKPEIVAHARHPDQGFTDEDQWQTTAFPLRNARFLQKILERARGPVRRRPQAFAARTQRYGNRLSAQAGKRQPRPARGLEAQAAQISWQRQLFLSGPCHTPVLRRFPAKRFDMKPAAVPP